MLVNHQQQQNLKKTCTFLVFLSLVYHISINQILKSL